MSRRNASGMYEEKVGAVFVVADTEKHLADAVAKVKRGEPLLCSTMRVRASKIVGEVCQVDRAARTARLRWREPTSDGGGIVEVEREFAWVRLVVT